MMLVRKAHEIEWVKKNYNSISPLEYYERLKPIFEKENIVFNGFIGEWKGNVTKLGLVCCEGHEFTPTITNFRRGTRCPKCAHNYALSKEEYLERFKPIFIKENIIFNGFIGEWNGNKTKMNLLCEYGHEFNPIISSFQAGKRCFKCSKNYARSKEEYLERLKPIFVEENITCNGFVDEWKGVNTRLKLLCDHGHGFSPRITDFQNGTRCPKCAKYGYNPLKKGTLYIQKLIKEHLLIGVKFGVTNSNTTKRLKQQSSKSQFDHEIFYELTLQDGQKILELENKIKEAMKGKTSYISKVDMPDGYTETVAPSELSTIMYIVKSFEKELTA